MRVEIEPRLASACSSRVEQGFRSVDPDLNLEPPPSLAGGQGFLKIIYPTLEFEAIDQDKFYQDLLTMVYSLQK